MHAVKMKKTDCGIIVVQTATPRLRSAPPVQRHKDKRKTTKSAARVKLRKEFQYA